MHWSLAVHWSTTKQLSIAHLFHRTIHNFRCIPLRFTLEEKFWHIYSTLTFTPSLTHSFNYNRKWKWHSTCILELRQIFDCALIKTDIKGLSGECTHYFYGLLELYTWGRWMPSRPVVSLVDAWSSSAVPRRFAAAPTKSSWVAIKFHWCHPPSSSFPQASSFNAIILSFSRNPRDLLGAHTYPSRFETDRYHLRK